MHKGEIASVVWHEVGHRIEVAYLEGDPDFFYGDELVITQMVEDEGLKPVPAPDHVRRWERVPTSALQGDRRRDDAGFSL
jgi:hypothetical protein